MIVIPVFYVVLNYSSIFSPTVSTLSSWPGHYLLLGLRGCFFMLIAISCKQGMALWSVWVRFVHHFIGPEVIFETEFIAQLLRFEGMSYVLRFFC